MVQERPTTRSGGRSSVPHEDTRFDAPLCTHPTFTCCDFPMCELQYPGMVAMCPEDPVLFAAFTTEFKVHINPKHRGGKIKKTPPIPYPCNVWHWPSASTLLTGHCECSNDTLHKPHDTLRQTPNPVTKQNGHGDTPGPGELPHSKLKGKMPAEVCNCGPHQKRKALILDNYHSAHLDSISVFPQPSFSASLRLHHHP